MSKFKPVECYAIVDGDGPFFDCFCDIEDAEICLRDDDEKIVPARLVPREAVVFESAAEFSEFLDSQTVDAELTPMEALAEWRKSREAKLK